MSEMIERVARVIYQTDGMPMQIARVYARAAIAAMREPTPEMKAAEGVHWEYPCHVCGGLKEGWQAMIDAALEVAPMTATEIKLRRRVADDAWQKKMDACLEPILNRTKAIIEKKTSAMK